MACRDEKAMGSSLTTEPFLAIESHRSSEQAVCVPRTEHKALPDERIAVQIRRGFDGAIMA
jgi:hypothetical protein